MSRATKRKHVVRELLEERVLPAPRQRIVRVLGTPGNNLHEVETAEGTRFLASMPPRFRRHIWIKRGDFLLVDPIEEGTKVKAEMSLVLLPPHVRFLQRQGLWPEAFTPLEKSSPREGHPPARDGDLFVNTNRVGAGGDTGASEDTGDEDDETGDEDNETGDEDNETGDEDDETGDDEDTGDNNDDMDNEEDTGDKNDTGDTNDTPPRDSGDKDRGAGGSGDRRCPPQ